MKNLHKNVPITLTRNVGVLQEMNGNHNVKLSSNICYFVSFHTIYPRGQQSSKGQKRMTGRKKMTKTVCVALGVSLHTGTVMIIYNVDLLDFLKKISLY